MIELLADPSAAPLWGVFLMALGMYPVGLMLGASCSPCCGGCSACIEGKLPETLTVTLSWLPETTKGPPLVTLSFSACYGSGGSGIADEPGQSSPESEPEDDRGPITAVTLTDGGSGYAKLGRTSPTVTATGSGSGATLTVTLSQHQDECKVDYWNVKSISGSGGTGYTDDEQVQFTVASGDTAEEHATARIRTVREEPEVTLGASTAQGSGAALEAVFASSAGSPATWGIDSVTVVDGGDLYARGDMVTVAVKSQTTEVVAATLTINVTHAEPTVTASIPYSAGTGASLTANLSPITSPLDGANVWEVESVTVNAAGSGYEAYDPVLVAVSDGSPNSSLANAYVWEVDENGAVLSVHVDGGGEYFKGAPIDSVTVNDGGQYFKNSGSVSSVEVDTGGVYYREDASLTPYVASVTVTINQALPSDGAGASISATVDDDPESETFGEIISLAISNGGDGYLAHLIYKNCLDRFNGRSIVVTRNYPFWESPQLAFFPSAVQPAECTYAYTCSGIDSCALEAEAVLVEYNGPTSPMKVWLMLHQRAQYDRPLGGGYLYPAAYGLLAVNENISNCDEIDVVAYGVDAPVGSIGEFINLTAESTAHVQAGGEYEESDTCARISEEDLQAVYVEVSWAGISSSGSAETTGVCGWSSGISSPTVIEDTTGPWCENWKGTVLDRITQWGGPPVSWSASCSQSHQISGIPMTLDRGIGCQWSWAPNPPASVGTSIVRIAGVTFTHLGPGFSSISAGRQCNWVYPIKKIPVDADNMPSGQVELGEPTYTTSRGYNFLNADPPAFWFDDLFAEQDVCGNPGAPVITFSTLP